MIFKHSMRGFVFCLVLAMTVFLSVDGVQAQSQPLSEKERAKIEKTQEKISVYGKIYRVTLYTEAYPSLTWKEAKPYLPAEIKIASPALKTDDQILARLKALRDQKSAEYDAGYAIVLKQQIALRKDEDPDDVDLGLGEEFAANEGGKYSPDLQYVGNEVQALDYLYQMLYLKINHRYPGDQQ